MPTPIMCFDLDGTILIEHKKLHPNDQKILTSGMKQICFVPCTGRPLHSVKRLFSNIGLFKDSIFPFPTVTQNGSAVHTYGEKLIHYHPFSIDIQKSLIELMAEYPQTSCIYMHSQGSVMQSPNEYSRDWMERFTETWEPLSNDNKNLRFGKATIVTKEKNIMKELLERLAGFPVEFGNSLSEVLDVNPKGISKRSGMEELLEELNLDQGPICTAGDGENDLDLFGLADYAYAPITAPEKIRQQADQTIDILQNGLLTEMIEKGQSLTESEKFAI